MAPLVAVLGVACADVVIPSAGGTSEPGQGGGAGSTSEPALGGSGSAGAPLVPPEPAPLPGAHLFGDDSVLEIHLTVDEADLAYLDEHGNEETYVPAQATLRGSGVAEVTLANVGLRHKGAYTLHHCWDQNGGVRSYEGSCAKLSYKLKFDEYLPDARVDGLKRLNLHASAGDSTLLRELLAYSLFRDFGVDAPRTAIAKVIVNGSVAGTFITVEAIDGRYTKAHFPANGDGDLYKEIWPSSGLDTGAAVAALRTNEDSSDASAFLGFASAVSASTHATFATDMAPWVDLDHVLRYIAVDRALKNWDGIMAFYSPSSPHNFYWYHDSGSSGRFQLVPWDLDNTFWEFDPFMDPQAWVSADRVPDWNEEPANCDARSVWDTSYALTITPPRCDRFLDLLAETQFDRWTTFAGELLGGPFELTRLRERAHAFGELLEPLVATDPHMDLARWRYDRQAFEQGLQRAVQDFQAFVAAGPRVEPVPEPLEPVVSDAGLDVTRSNGFEFIGSIAAEAPAGVSGDAAEGTTFSALWNAATPIAGSRDLRFDFQFARQPSLWDEWVNFVYSTPGAEEVDLTEHRVIIVSLRADRSRNVRLRLASPVYEDTFGGVWSELGTDVTVAAQTTSIEVLLDELVYPAWAKAAWQPGQGWSTSDAAAYALVRQRVSGLIFAPSPTFDGSGELAAQTEAGYLHVDDIEFRP